MKKTSFFGCNFLILTVSWLFLTLRPANGQFYNIYPAVNIVPNSLSLNATIIPIGAFLALTLLDGEVKLSRTSFDVICIECQKEYINNDPNLLPDMKIEVLYYDTSVVNTSKASISALEYSLTSNHIATIGKYKNILFSHVFIYFRP